MAAVHGALNTFDMEKESWSSYTERLEFYFDAHEVTSADKKRSILLSACDTSAFETLKNLVRPQQLKDKSFEELVAAMEKHLNPPSSKLKYRYELFTARRRSGESIPAFVSRLQSLGQYCAYGDAVLNDMIRDAFVFGVNDVHIQRCLFQEKEDFSLQTAIETATSIKLSVKDTSRFQTSKSSQSVFKVGHEKPKDQKDVTCYRCGGPHLATQCRFKEAICRSCGKKGHIAKVCRSRPARSSSKPSSAAKKPVTTHTVQESPSVVDIQDPSPPISLSPKGAYSMFTVRSQVKPITIPVKIRNKQLLMELDTGASLSIVDEATYRSIFGEDHYLEQSDIVLKTYNGQCWEQSTHRSSMEGSQRPYLSLW